jgi:hypothetical protein
MDVSGASYYIKEKLKIKVAKWGTPKKNLKRKQKVSRNLWSITLRCFLDTCGKFIFLHFSFL